MTNECGCDLFVHAPYLQEKFVFNSSQTTVMSGETLPAWMEFKIKRRPPFLSLLILLSVGQAFGSFLFYLWMQHLVIYCHIILPMALVYTWLHFTVCEVSVLISRPLGVQSSCRFLSGRWKRSPLIPTHRIRTIHLVDRVTNTSVLPQLFLELYQPSHTSASQSRPTDANKDVRLQPLLSIPGGNNSGTCLKKSGKRQYMRIQNPRRGAPLAGRWSFSSGGLQARWKAGTGLSSPLVSVSEGVQGSSMWKSVRLAARTPWY
uniref:Glycerophosphocholine acyltransferase 1 n=1 Tax=Mesocestoides corti TaxID=53468 RepID=A0A5K3ELZ3_MESCO